MDKIREIFDGLFIGTMDNIYQQVKAAMPNIVNAALILVIGWLLAVTIKKIVAKLLRAFGLDAVSEKAGIKRFFEKGGLSLNLSSIIGAVFYWILILSALTMAFNVLEMDIAYQFLKQIIFYLPRVFVVLVLVLLGMYLSRLSEKFISTTARLTAIPFYETLGKVSRYAIMGIVIMMSLEHLGVAASIVTNSFIILFGLVPLTCLIIFALSSKDLIASMFAKGFIQKTYKPGDFIVLGNLSGKIISIDLISTTVESHDKEIIIPNIEIIKNTTQRSRPK